MRRCVFVLIFLVSLHMTSLADASPPASSEDDPYIWLEEVDSQRALDWARAHNAACRDKLESDPSFPKLREELLAILDSDERIPFVSKHGEYLYNFWRDKANPRGLWRRTTLAEYRKPEPQWDVLLNLDAIAEAEKENWIWAGAKLLRPDYKLALVALSRGGADATTTREFDVERRTWIEQGFVRPEAKGSLGWIDRDHVFAQTDFGPGSLTTSGYPRIAKLWTRGTPLTAATVVFEGQSTDMSVAASHDDSPGFERDFVHRGIAFYNNELYLRRESGELIKLDAPNSANKQVFRQYLALELREPWTTAGRSYPAGALLVGLFDDVIAGRPRYDMVFEPTPTTALTSYGFTRDHLLLNVLDDVKNRVYSLTREAAGWRREPLLGAADLGRVDVSAVESDESNDYFMTTTGFLTPTTLSLGTIGEQPQSLKSLPKFFDATGLAVEQRFATSADGTRVPYFLVGPKDLPLSGDHPTLLYGYGGFEISLLPHYNAGVGRAWLSQGGVYVVANIRGGGEYGPRWHQAAQKANRLRAYEDFAAVARDLVASKITCPRRLGVQGGSNGGLLVANMVTLYPELFHAAVCQVPLADMRRYNQLLAGASWMAEYGNPDLPEEWEFIRKFSPYQNLRADAKYPAVLFTTSTRDDRVHPGHARKMMARMEAQGHAALYYENIEGGHGGAANNQQAAYMQALAYTFLKQQLMNE